uniref:(northern house mosquito) hypothetical protein n=1 Tax=Culex pipiens TaxID=7175 RepID=A0A8D8H5N0_CULPI
MLHHRVQLRRRTEVSVQQQHGLVVDFVPRILPRQNAPFRYGAHFATLELNVPSCKGQVAFEDGDVSLVVAVHPQRVPVHHQPDDHVGEQEKAEEHHQVVLVGRQRAVLDVEWDGHRVEVLQVGVARDAREGDEAERGDDVAGRQIVLHGGAVHEPEVQRDLVLFAVVFLLHAFGRS